MTPRRDYNIPECSSAARRRQLFLSTANLTCAYLRVFEFPEDRHGASRDVAVALLCRYPHINEIAGEISIWRN